MTSGASVGMSRHHNPNVAGRRGWGAGTREKAGVSKPDFVFMFGSIGYDQQSLVRAVRETTEGHPSPVARQRARCNGDDADESNFSVVVTAISSEELRWHHRNARGFGVGLTRRGEGGLQGLVAPPLC